MPPKLPSSSLLSFLPPTAPSLDDLARQHGEEKESGDAQSLTASHPSSLDDTFSLTAPSIATLPVSLPSTSQAPAARNIAGLAPRIQNLVCSVHLGCDVDLKTIAMRARNAEYNPKRFAAAILRLREPKSTGLVFRNGKLICAGAKSEEAAMLAVKKYTRLVQRIGFPAAECGQFTMINLVATINVRFPIRIESLAADYEDEASYEPEIFPGLIYRLTEPKVVVLVFVSGKCVITGAKSEAQVHEAINVIYPIIELYKKNPSSAMVGNGASATAIGTMQQQSQSQS